MRKRPAGKRKEARKPPPPKSGAGREGGLRSLGSLRRGAGAPERKMSEVNVASHQQRQMRKVASKRQNRPEQQVSSNRSRRATKKPTR